MQLKPLNDYALVEILDENSQDGLDIQASDSQYVGARKGRVLSVGRVTYLSTNAWVYPLRDFTPPNQVIPELSERAAAQKQFDSLVGQIIYWEKFTDNNATVDYRNGKKYAFIKLSKIVGFEPDEPKKSPKKEGEA